MTEEDLLAAKKYLKEQKVLFISFYVISLIVCFFSIVLYIKAGSDLAEIIENRENETRNIDASSQEIIRKLDSLMERTNHP